MPKKLGTRKHLWVLAISAAMSLKKTGNQTEFPKTVEESCSQQLHNYNHQDAPGWLKTDF
ncbi:hypothetical protein [Thiolapillus sp.]